MTSSERELITDLKKCDFRQIDVYYKEQSEKRKAMTKEEKNKIKVGGAFFVCTLVYVMPDIVIFTSSLIIFSESSGREGGRGEGLRIRLHRRPQAEDWQL